LRAVVGDISLDDVLAKREQINNQLRVKLDEVTERWGVKVNSVEIREIIPPSAVQEAMNRQMSAERNRRAVVTEAEGKREAAVTVATGEKQAAILASEGARQSSILRAEGSAQALQTIYGVAQSIDPKTMSLQYMDTLKALGSGQSTKIVIPMELTQLLQPFVSMANAASSAQQPAPSDQNPPQTYLAVPPPAPGEITPAEQAQVPAPVQNGSLPAPQIGALPDSPTET
jgi:regulator of protease activity HflC (stomatin/prohibitin superfamily)